jgi:hypothetical protein
MPPPPPRRPGRPRDDRPTSPRSDAGLGAYITTDGGGARRKPLPHWLSEVQVHPDHLASESSVRIVRDEDLVEEAPPFDAEAELDAEDAVEVREDVESPADVVDVVEAAEVEAAPAEQSEGDEFFDLVGDDDEPSGEPRVLGVNIAGGVAYLAVIEPPGRVVPDITDRIVPDREIEGGEQLAEFSNRLARFIRDLRIDAVAIARPLHYTDWRYTDAYARVSLETCLMLEAHRLSLRCESVGQHHAANVVGLPMSRASNMLAARLGMARTLDWLEWPNRFPAALVGLAVALQARV